MIEYFSGNITFFSVLFSFSYSKEIFLPIFFSFLWDEGPVHFFLDQKSKHIGPHHARALVQKYELGVVFHLNPKTDFGHIGLCKGTQSQTAACTLTSFKPKYKSHHVTRVGSEIPNFVILLKKKRHEPTRMKPLKRGVCRETVATCNLISKLLFFPICLMCILL